MYTITESDDPTRIEPDVEPATVSLPAALGNRIATFFGVEQVETGADWINALETGMEPAGEDFGLDDLCTTDESPHVLETATTEQAYQCVIDPLVVPFVTDEPGTIRSACPVEGEEIVVAIDADGVRARPETAFFSLGIAEGAVERAGDPPHSPASTYGAFCPYANAFASKDAYETWAAETDAVTARVPLEYGVTLVGTLAQRMTADE